MYVIEKEQREYSKSYNEYCDSSWSDYIDCFFAKDDNEALALFKKKGYYSEIENENQFDVYWNQFNLLQVIDANIYQEELEIESCETVATTDLPLEMDDRTLSFEKKEDKLLFTFSNDWTSYTDDITLTKLQDHINDIRNIDDDLADLIDDYLDINSFFRGWMTWSEQETIVDEICKYIK